MAKGKKKKQPEPVDFDSSTGRLSLMLKERIPYDDLDLKIMMILKRNARITNIALAKELDVNEVTINRRLNNLFDRELIKCSFTIINYEKLGFMLKAIVVMRVDMDNMFKVIKDIKSKGNVVSVYKIIDLYKKHNLFTELMFLNMTELQDYLTQLSKMKGVQEYDYFLLTKTFKHDIFLRL
jgi:Lrp/AsnC family leucine-responsive transcriptional regulator